MQQKPIHHLLIPLKPTYQGQTQCDATQNDYKAEDAQMPTPPTYCFLTSHAIQSLQIESTMISLHPEVPRVLDAHENCLFISLH